MVDEAAALALTGVCSTVEFLSITDPAVLASVLAVGRKALKVWEARAGMTE